MWRRFYAMLLDFIIVWVAFFTAWILITSVYAAARPYTGSTVFYMAMLLFGWLYSALLESSPAQGTLGKLGLMVRVTDVSGGRIGFGRASARFFGKLTSAAPLCIGFLIADVTARKQALHDLLAGTCVVRKQELQKWLESGAAGSSAPAWTRTQTLRASLGLGFSVLIIGCLGYCFDMQISSTNALRTFCESLKPGMGREQLDSLINTRGFAHMSDEDPSGATVLLRQPKSIYPNVCYIELEAGKVKSAKFVPYN